MSNIENKDSSFWDKMNSKYVAIWIWIALFIVNATVTYQLAKMIPTSINDYPIVVIVLALMIFYGLYLIFRSWISLIKYFELYLIPVFFPKHKYEIDEYELNTNSQLLLNSLKYLMNAVFIGIATLVVQFIVKLIF